MDSWPSTDPLVTSVGGTQLHLNAEGGVRTEPDNVWNDTNIFGSPAAGGAGGTSEFFSRPAYQGAGGSPPWWERPRGTPDISLTRRWTAPPWCNSASWTVTWFLPDRRNQRGQPAAFSGVVAIADQAAGRDLGGLLNPELYKLAAANAPGISDITIGNNTVTFAQGGKSHTVAGWAAVPGYDLASGLGTVDGAQLVAELAAAG